MKPFPTSKPKAHSSFAALKRHRALQLALQDDAFVHTFNSCIELQSAGVRSPFVVEVLATFVAEAETDRRISPQFVSRVRASIQPSH